jgi:hypothetical protein
VIVQSGAKVKRVIALIEAHANERSTTLTVLDAQHKVTPTVQHRFHRLRTTVTRVHRALSEQRAYATRQRNDTPAQGSAAMNKHRGEEKTNKQTNKPTNHNKEAYMSKESTSNTNHTKKRERERERERTRERGNVNESV